jgi:hypothetical protein
MKQRRSKRFMGIKNFAKLSKKKLLSLVKRFTQRNKYTKQRGG